MSETTPRETKKVDIKNGEQTIVVELNTYVTGRELRKVEAAMFDDAMIKQKGQEQEMAMSGKMLEARQDAQIIAVVVSIDGDTKNIVDRILDDYPAPVSQEIMSYVKELTEPKKATAGDSEQ